MDDEKKSKQELMDELNVLRRKIMNIAERKQAEDILREQEEELAAIYENAPLIMLLVDKEWRIKKANVFSSQLTGRSVGDMVDLRCGDGLCCIHALDTKEGCGFGPACKDCTLRLTAIDTIETGQSHHGVEVSIFLSDGGNERNAVFLISTTKLVIKGQPTALLSIQDVTERKRAEEALRESEERYRNVFEDHSAVKLLIDPDTGNIIEANKAAANYYGWSRERLKEMKIQEINTLPPEDIKKEMEKAITNKRIHFEFRHRRADGSIRNVEVFSSKIQVKGKNILHSIIHDITERKTMEDALRKSEEQYRSLVESTKDSIYLLDRDLRYLFANNTYLERVGHTLQQLIGKSYSELHPFPNDAFPEYVNRVFETGESTEFEYKSFRDNKPFLRTLGPVRGKQGETIAVTVLSKDVTLLKKTENALRKYQVQLRSLMGRIQAAREEERVIIAREIHDELGGALTGLKIDLSYLAATLPKMRDTAKRNSFVNKLKTMTNLIDETIHTVRRMITDIRPSILDDFGLIVAIEWQAQEFQKRTGIECEFISSLEDIPFDEQHSTAVFRIFQESLTNVIRHAAATKVTVRLYKEADRLVLKVTDNGKGLIEEKISDPKSMGLLGMRERALFLGGKVDISGEPWKGTTVSVYIPLAK